MVPKFMLKEICRGKSFEAGDGESEWKADVTKGSCPEPDLVLWLWK